VGPCALEGATVRSRRDLVGYVWDRALDSAEADNGTGISPARWCWPDAEGPSANLPWSAGWRLVLSGKSIPVSAGHACAHPNWLRFAEAH